MPSDLQLWRHRISRAKYDAILEAQGGVCAICYKPMERPHIDHDHGCCPATTPGGRYCGNCVRGILCVGCNTFLGRLERVGLSSLARGLDYLTGDNYSGSASGITGEDILKADAVRQGVSWDQYARLYGIDSMTARQADEISKRDVMVDLGLRPAPVVRQRRSCRAA